MLGDVPRAPPISARARTIRVVQHAVAVQAAARLARQVLALARRGRIGGHRDGVDAKRSAQAVQPARRAAQASPGAHECVSERAGRGGGGRRPVKHVVWRVWPRHCDTWQRGSGEHPLLSWKGRQDACSASVLQPAASSRCSPQRPRRSASHAGVAAAAFSSPGTASRCRHQAATQQRAGARRETAFAAGLTRTYPHGRCDDAGRLGDRRHGCSVPAAAQARLLASSTRS